MSFVDKLRERKLNLSHAKTTVTTAGGDMYVEESTSQGIKIEMCSKGSRAGFVIDNKPDLQVANILPWVSMGSQDVVHDHHLLREHGITHVLSLGIDPGPHHPLITYTYIQLFDLPEVNLLRFMEQAVSLFEAVREEGGKIFVHCNAGVSRSAAIVIAYIMYEKQVTFKEAFEDVKSIRPCIKPNDGFVNQLKIYEKQIL